MTRCGWNGGEHENGWRDGDGVEASRDKGGAIKTRWGDGETKVGVMMEW